MKWIVGKWENTIEISVPQFALESSPSVILLIQLQFGRGFHSFFPTGNLTKKSLL